MKTRVLQQEGVAKLQPGEQLIWSGHPITGVEGQLADFWLVPLGLLLAGYALHWMWSAQAAGGYSASLLGVPLLLVGLYLAGGRLLYRAHQRAHTAYFITSERVLIQSGLLFKQATSFDLNRLPPLTLVEKPDRTGTILFGTSHSRYAALARVGWPGVPQVPQFARVPEVRQVYSRLGKLERRSR